METRVRRSATPCLPECPALNTDPERLSLPLDHRVLVLRFESLDGVLHHNLEISFFFLLLSDVLSRYGKETDVE